MAALIDGLHVSGLDQTGLTQKGGPVVSDLRISREPLAAASKAPAGSVDLYLGFDLLGAAADKNLVTAAPDRTVAVVSTSAVPTGRMVIDLDERFPELVGAARPHRRASTRREHNLYLDAQQLSERLFGDHMLANTLALGAAYQRGLLPVSAGGARAGDPAQRRGGREEPGRVRVGPRGAWPPRTPSSRPPRPPDAPRRELTDAERELVALAVNGDARRAAPARRDPRARARRLPGRGLRAPLRRGGPPGPRGRAGAHARPRRAGRGRRPPPVQADGLQGRVRGRPPAPRRRRAGASCTPSSARTPRSPSTCTRRCCARWAWSASSSSGAGSCPRSGRSTGCAACAARSSTRSAAPRCAGSSAS